MATVTTDKATTVPGSTPTIAKEDVRRILADARFVETIDDRITERLRPIMEQLANISSALQTLTEGRSSGATGSSVAASAVAPPAGTSGATAAVPSTGTVKLEAEPRSPEPAVFMERQLGAPDQWKVFDAKDPTTFIPKDKQGTTNP